MKTYKEFEVSNLNLSEFLIEPTEIDEELALFIGESVPPSYLSQRLCQGGDAEKEEDGVLFYTTTYIVNGKHFYLGILPEFKQ